VIDKKKLLVHAILLGFQFFLAIIACIPYYVIPNVYYKIEVVLTSVDILIQLMICYICYSMGTDITLRKNRCVLSVSETGGMEMSFEPTNWVDTEESELCNEL
jgi:hypothetical protein